MPRVNPTILRWARETARLTPDDAVSKLRLGAARGVPAVERLHALENGEAQPTRAMLVRMAKQYRRPLVTFYLLDPPKRGDRGQDFRSLPQDYSESDEALLDALIRDVQARQSLVRAAMIAEEEAEPLSFIGSASREQGVEAVLRSIRETLDLSLAEFRAAPNQEEAFRTLRESAEAAGVFVLILGNLGSHHTDIDIEAFRGFALADDIAPFLIINHQDHRGAWSFTLLHELTHLWLGETGVSGGTPELAVERFCNDVASEYLLPAAELADLRLPAISDVAGLAAAIGDFAMDRNISHSMVAYRLYRGGIIDRSLWGQLGRWLGRLWAEQRDYRRQKARQHPGGPDYYVLRRHRLGPGLVRFTARMMATGALTTTKAGRVLGVKPKNVQSLIGQYRTAPIS